MRFEPKTDQELAEAKLLPKGEYDYEVSAAFEKVSKSGNDMIEMKVVLYVGESTRTFTDYLLDAMPEKLKHFCQAHGLTAQYERGELTADDCEGRMGKCKVDTQKGKNGYSDKSQIVDYCPTDSTGRSASAPQRATQPVAAAVSDDDVPF